jgi:23S rRNA (uracil1939-C5)-methyltransferase
MATFFTPKSGKSKNQQHSKTSELVIDAHDHAGNGLCLSSKPITIVPDGLLGEMCQVRFNKQTKKVNFADTTKIIAPSLLRVTPFCEYYSHCGGCSLQHTSAKHGLALKLAALTVYISKQLNLASTFANSEAWEKPVVSAIDYSNNPVNTHYRRRIRLAVDARNKQKVKIGFRAQRSQSIIDIPKCAVASSVINDCLPLLREALTHLPSIHRVGHIVITEGEVALQVALFTSQALCKKSIAKLSELAALLTVEIVVKTKGFDAICLSSNSIELAIYATGKKPFSKSALLIEDVPGTKLAIESAHFLQVNKAVNQGLIKKARAWLNPDNTHTLYDFFCGSGNFALSFAPYVGAVKGFEGVKGMVDVAKVNAANIGINSCDFTTIDLSSSDDLKTLTFVDNAIAILDPSREGASELCQFLATQNIEKIVYVSCNPNSFARDVAYLIPRYKLSKIAALDMFPFTKHLEVMGLFTLHK